jgi:ABC-type ATPase with predicted acetyltransferase domain
MSSSFANRMGNASTVAHAARDISGHYMKGGFMKTRGKCSRRAGIVARWFGITAKDVQTQLIARPQVPEIHPRSGQIILLSGPSGAGKSTLLRQLFRQHRRRTNWIDMQKIELPRVPVIDLLADYFGEPSDEAAILAALRALSRVGLGEVWTYLRTPDQLSDGQRWRLRLAVGLARALEGLGVGVQGSGEGEEGSGKGRRSSARLNILAADEFAAPLDRVTALVVARALRKAVDRQPDLCAIVATTRDDLLPALAPDVHVRCDFGVYDLSLRG